MPAVSSRGKGRRTKNEINMVPFIDVMLVLLIIFMVTAPMLTPSQIDLPSVGQADRQPDHFVQVIVDKDAALKVRDGSSNRSAASVELADLVERVRELQGPAEPGKGTAPVVISADKNVRYETVVQVMDRLQRAGIQRVGLSVQQNP